MPYLNCRLTVDPSDFVLAVTDTALTETDFETTYLYYLMYIFQSFFSTLGQVMIIHIIARTITEDLGTVSAKVTSFFIGLLWILAIVDFGFVTAEYAEVISQGRADGTASLGWLYVSITYASYTFFISIYLAILAILAILRRSSTVYTHQLPRTNIGN
jgi:hypothetical protein